MYRVFPAALTTAAQHHPNAFCAAAVSLREILTARCCCRSPSAGPRAAERRGRGWADHAGRATTSGRRIVSTAASGGWATSWRGRVGRRGPRETRAGPPAVLTPGGDGGSGRPRQLSSSGEPSGSELWEGRDPAPARRGAGARGPGSQRLGPGAKHSVDDRDSRVVARLDSVHSRPGRRERGEHTQPRGPGLVARGRTASRPRASRSGGPGRARPAPLGVCGHRWRRPDDQDRPDLRAPDHVLRPGLRMLTVLSGPLAGRDQPWRGGGGLPLLSPA